LNARIRRQEKLDMVEKRDFKEEEVTIKIYNKDII